MGYVYEGSLVIECPTCVHLRRRNSHLGSPKQPEEDSTGRKCVHRPWTNQATNAVG